MSEDKKRGNYEGSKPKQRKDGRFQVNVRLPDVGRKSFYGKTKTEAQQKARKAVQMAEDRKIPSNERVKVEQWLTRWIAEKREYVRPKTWVRYEEIVRLHLVPGLGKMQLTKLTWRHLDDFYKERLKVGLSPQSVRHIRAVLRAALQDAIRDRLVTQNEAKLSHPVKMQRTKKKQVISEEEARHLFVVAVKTENRLAALYLLALCTTMREGELLALRWSDVNFKTGCIEVDETVYYLHGKFEFGPPKTEQAERTIELPPVAVLALKAHQERQEAERREKGDLWDDSYNLVFPNTVGRPIASSNLLRRSFYPLLKRAGLPRVRFHDLRHTSISLSIADGNDLNLVAAIAGHHDASFTLKQYGHMIPGKQEGNRKTMERIFGGNGGQMVVKEE